MNWSHVNADFFNFNKKKEPFIIYLYFSIY